MLDDGWATDAVPFPIEAVDGMHDQAARGALQIRGFVGEAGKG